MLLSKEKERSASTFDFASYHTLDEVLCSAEHSLHLPGAVPWLCARGDIGGGGNETLGTLLLSLGGEFCRARRAGIPPRA